MSALAIVPRETTDAPVADRIHSLPVDFVSVGPNVRVNMVGLDELAASIAEHGVLQPIKVRHAPDGAAYVVIWGQRRLLAARQAGLTEIPALIDDAERAPEQLSIEQLVENLHREDLNPIDRANAMRQVVNAGMSQADLARTLGIAPSTVSNDLGLLEAPAKIRNALLEGTLTPAHAKALKGLAHSTQAELAARAVKDGLSAHELERAVQDHKRTEEWRKEQADRSRQDAEGKQVRIAEAVERIAKRIPKDAAIWIGLGWNGAHVAEILAKLLAEAGYTNVTKGRPTGWLGYRKESIDCDCKAWSLEVAEYSGQVTIHEACIVRKHYEAKLQADSRIQNAGFKLRADVKAKLAEALVDEVASLGPLAARAALWQLLGWARDGWARDRDAATGTTRKKRNPWASISEMPLEDLRAEVTKRLAEGLQDGDFKVDWAGLAAELGIEAPA